jgi:DNA-binding NtrC family response regulator
MLNAAPGDQKTVAVLAVIPDEGDRAALRAIFRHCNWILSFAGSIEETRRFLREEAAPLILCDRDLPDGSWKDLMLAVKTFRHPPRLVVTARKEDDRLCAEALILGCHGVLSQPFDSGEMFGLLSRAWRNWHGESEIGEASRPRAFTMAGAAT